MNGVRAEDGFIAWLYKYSNSNNFSVVAMRSQSLMLGATTLWLSTMLCLSFHARTPIAFSFEPSRRRFTTPLYCATPKIADSRCLVFDQIVMDRFACKRFRRSDGQDKSPQASPTNETVVQDALHCLEVARHSPSAFNTQPYKLLLVHSPQARERLAKWCLGPNKQRVLDSDCSVVVLADREIGRSFGRFGSFLRENPQRPPTTRMIRTMQFYTLIFSSGYPMPRWIRAPMSFCVRIGVYFTNLLSSYLFRYQLPTLANAETWSSKNAALVAMTYMLGCSARGLATIPMEGINAGGIRRVLNIPRRYAIPVVIATGLPYQERTAAQKMSGRRYPMTEMIYQDEFGQMLTVVPSLT